MRRDRSWQLNMDPAFRVSLIGALAIAAYHACQRGWHRRGRIIMEPELEHLVSQQIEVVGLLRAPDPLGVFGRAWLGILAAGGGLDAHVAVEEVLLDAAIAVLGVLSAGQLFDVGEVLAAAVGGQRDAGRQGGSVYGHVVAN